MPACLSDVTFYGCHKIELRILKNIKRHCKKLRLNFIIMNFLSISVKTVEFCPKWLHRYDVLKVCIFNWPTLFVLILFLGNMNIFIEKLCAVGCNSNISRQVKPLQIIPQLGLLRCQAFFVVCHTDSRRSCFFAAGCTVALVSLEVVHL